ncbi:Uncharacterised protein [Serratia fonticola]|uniref:Uncharacterized protein n=1 Tax=Serratia fonticola TaxID=47917 RepID=A0A4U9UEZ9_SERFO|nr:Uncharacterised protein [Serratia fonticola]
MLKSGPPFPATTTRSILICQHVRKMGADQLSVHGMRAMLDMKRHLSEVLLATPLEHDFYVFSARMRRPVLCQTPYHLQIAGSGKQITGKLLDSVTQESCFNSKLAPAQSLEPVASEYEHALTVNEVMALSQRFPGTGVGGHSGVEFL